jgi:hypothetical protein
MSCHALREPAMRLDPRGFGRERTHATDKGVTIVLELAFG